MRIVVATQLLLSKIITYRTVSTHFARTTVTSTSFRTEPKSAESV